MFAQANKPWFINWLGDSAAAVDPKAQPEAHPASQPEDLRSLFNLDKKVTSPFQDFGHPLEKARRFVAYADQYQSLYWKDHNIIDAKETVRIVDSLCKDIQWTVNEQESERDGQSSNQDQHARFRIALQTILKKRACDGNWRQIFNAYRFGARAYFKDEQRNNILMLACMAHQSKNQRIELVKIILENHPLPTEADLQISRLSRKDIAQQCNKENKTALMIAQANGDIEISDLINARLAEIDTIQQRVNAANSKQQEKT